MYIVCASVLYLHVEIKCVLLTKNACVLEIVLSFINVAAVTIPPYELKMELNAKYILGFGNHVMLIIS